MSLNQLQTLVSEGHPYWYSYAVSRGLFSESLSPVSGTYYASIENAWNSLWNEMQNINSDFRSKTTKVYDGRIFYDPKCTTIINKTTGLDIYNFDNWKEIDIRYPDRMKRKLNITYELFRSADNELFKKFHEQINKLYNDNNNKYNYTSTNNKISSELDDEIRSIEEKQRELRSEHLKKRREEKAKKRLQQEGEFNDNNDDDDVEALEKELELIEKEKKEVERQLNKIKQTNYREQAIRAARKQMKKEDKQRIKRESIEKIGEKSIEDQVSEAIEKIKNTRRTCFDDTDVNAKLDDNKTSETCFDQYQLIYNLIRKEKDEEVKKRIKKLLEEFQSLYTENQKKKKGDPKKFHRTGRGRNKTGLTHEKLLNTLLNEL